MRRILILIILFNLNLIANDWKQVHYEQYQEIESIDCTDSLNCFSFVNHYDGFEGTSWRLYRSSNQGLLWEMIYKAKNIFEQEEPQVIHIKEGISPYPNYYFGVSEEFKQ